jgi:hypothetical protein
VVRAEGRPEVVRAEGAAELGRAEGAAELGRAEGGGGGPRRCGRCAPPRGPERIELGEPERSVLVRMLPAAREANSRPLMAAATLVLARERSAQTRGARL